MSKRQRLFNTLPLLLIRGYQRFISPYKGFRCAHAVHFGGDSCSAAVMKIIRRRGVFAGRHDIRRQFQRCSVAYQQISKDQKDKKRRKNDGKWWHSCDPCPASCSFGEKKSSCADAMPCDMGGIDLPCVPCAWLPLKRYQR